MAILKLIMREELTLNGVDRTNEYTRTIDTVTETDCRMVTIGTTEVEILKFGASVGAGQFVGSDVKYIRITHLEPASAGSVKVTLRITDDTAYNEYFVVLPEGASYILANADIDTYAQSNTIGGVSSLSKITGIKAVSTSTSNLNVFVAE